MSPLDLLWKSDNETNLLTFCRSLCGRLFFSSFSLQSAVRSPAVRGPQALVKLGTTRTTKAATATAATARFQPAASPR